MKTKTILKNDNYSLVYDADSFSYTILKNVYYQGGGIAFKQQICKWYTYYKPCLKLFNNLN